LVIEIIMIARYGNLWLYAFIVFRPQSEYLYEQDSYEGHSQPPTTGGESWGRVLFVEGEGCGSAPFADGEDRRSVPFSRTTESPSLKGQPGRKLATAS
jgi:hypothetical protein